MANALVEETKQGNFNNLAQVWGKRLEVFQDRPALALPKSPGNWQILSWGEFGHWVNSWAQVLQTKGLKSGDRLAFYAKTNWQWMVLDTATLCSGLVSVPIYETTAQQELLEILLAQEPKALFLEDDAQLKKLSEILKKATFLKFIILKQQQEHFSNPLPFAQVIAFDKGKPVGNHAHDAIEKARQNLNRDSPACVYHTSGTTGRPKPVPLTHGHLLSEMAQLMRRFDKIFGENDVGLSMLPYSHIFGRVEWMCHIVLGNLGYRMEGFEGLPDALQSARPSLMFTVPRVLEKIQSRIFLSFEDLGPHRRFIARCALNLDMGLPQSSWRMRLAKKLVYQKIKKRLGGNLKYFVTAGAPLSKNLALFFKRLGVDTIESFGMTECAGAGTATLGEVVAYGTIGKPLDQCEVAITDEGEMKIKGPNVFYGYGKTVEVAKSTLQESIQDGWFHTGDLAQWDENKNLKIIGRKKDLIVTAGGKKIAPQKIEHLLTQSQLIDQVVVVGNNRPYVVALIAPDRAYLAKVLKQPHLFQDKDWRVSPQIKQRIQNLLNEVNQHLSSFETIKKFLLLKEPLTPESGDLTLTQKPKRVHIEKKFATDDL